MGFVVKLVWLIGIWWCSPCAAERWRWPDQKTEESIRIDNKVRFVDTLDSTVNDRRQPSNVQADENPSQDFRQPQTYSSDRYPTGAEAGTHTYGQYVKDRRPQSSEFLSAYEAADTSVQQCKCTSDTRCSIRDDIPNQCGPGKHICCYKRQNKAPQSTEFFNEINDSPLYDGGDITSHGSNYFQPNRPHNNQPAVLVGPDGPTGIVGPSNNRPQLFGPDGPTGIIGPASVIKPGRRQNYYNNPDVLVGPDGPTGIIGPNTQVLVGPDGPTGIVGPHNRRPNVLVGPQGQNNLIQNPDILVGPDGPTGIIGPQFNRRPNSLNYQGPNNLIQNQNILVGPGRPTGSIGPKPNKPQVLVGPGGPTGIIGPNKPDVLVGPNGPTGIIGPNQNLKDPAILVGPGGPTGLIGPRGGNPDVLVGPGGPTGVIGPQRHENRGVLVGPGGPTGNIGPGRGYGLLSSRQSYSDYFGSRTPIYRGGDRNY